MKRNVEMRALCHIRLKEFDRDTFVASHRWGTHPLSPVTVNAAA